MSHRVCPWWLGYLLASPVRRLLQDPQEILRPFVAAGMKTLDIGCGMGFFTLPLADLVGPSGRVVAVDLQEEMIRGLKKRAEKAGLASRIDARTCRRDTLRIDDIAGRTDFALAFALAHEVPDRDRLFAEIFTSLKQGGKLLFAEPSGHVSKTEFEKAVAVARQAGFETISASAIRRSHAVLLAKPAV
jgi:ubiquinone/menaquinone biosynthesis C-methylase UbiE